MAVTKETKERMEKFGFKELDKVELTRLQSPVEVPYPKPERRFRIVQEVFNQSIEEIYFWTMGHMRSDFGFHDIKKIKDVYTASEQSAFWGAAQQRMQIQQGQVMTYMQSIGKLIQGLFGQVRELRIMDEKLSLYNETYKILEKEKGLSAEQRKMSRAAEITLKGYWVDLKDGGVKNPGSVYGLATQLGYATLPDLFFAAPVMKADEVDNYVEKLEFNPKVKGVLKRKLKGYLLWKEHTYVEHKNRRNFLIKYLRQHYNVIQMYIEWVKPYLRNVKRLAMNETVTYSEDIIGAFEGSVVEIEILGTRDVKTEHKPVIILTIYFRTRPSMDYHQDGYQHKGPIHVGRTEMTMRGYAWTQKQIDDYIKMRDEEVFDILGSIDASLRDSIQALGTDLRTYLKELGEEFPEDIKKKEEEEAEAKKKKENTPGILEPFEALLSGFKEIFTAFSPKLFTSGSKDKKMGEYESKGDKGKAQKEMEMVIWNMYKNFKKSHGMLSW